MRLQYLIFLLFVFPAFADTCNTPGYYLNENNECTECSINNYCIGDGIMRPCPALVYSSTEELKSMVVGYNVHSIAGAGLSSEIHYYGRDMVSIERCLLNIAGVEVDQGTIGLYLLFYSQQTGAYTTHDVTCWVRTNPGYYRYGRYFSDYYFYIGSCANSFPEHAHWADNTPPDNPNCLWECDTGYTLNINGTACVANIVTISWDDGDGNPSNNPTTQCTYDGGISTPTSIPTKLGHIFNGWKFVE